MTTYLVLRYDLVPGKEDEHERFLQDKFIPFCNRQSGIKGCVELEDAIIGWPERTVMIGANSLHDLEQILELPEYHSLKKEFLGLCSNIQSQIVTLRAGNLVV